jgi:hypothetical protein
MRVAPAVLALIVSVGGSLAADPVYIDQLMETPAATLQTHFAGLKKEGCYRLPDGRYVLLNIDRKSSKPSRVAISAAEPCRRAADVRTPMDLRHRTGVEIGDATPAVIEKMGRPDATTDAEAKSRDLGDFEYFYLCRIDEGCARHTSVFLRNGLVSAIAEWYSD